MTQPNTERTTPRHRTAPAARAASLIRLPTLRLGMLLILAGIVVLVTDLFVEADLGRISGWLLLIGFVPAVIGMVLTFWSPTDRSAALVVDPPVAGRWQAVNSPASAVPSHGTQAYGQAYAIDLVFLPEDREHPEFGKAGAGVLPPEQFPAFGEPLFAGAGGVVVRASDRLKDHGSRSNWPALLWFMIAEGLVREIGGAGRVIGNHAVVRLDDGSHLVYAHLKRGSLRVRRGDRVDAGQHLADCGNTGNSTEPHLHIHRQDVASFTFAAGLPWAIRGAGDGDVDGFPVNEATFDAVPASSGPLPPR
ncbi:M23 family metallopeptidase [Agromyces silvae]|uniref:M23 family metallopeptidase n=1 Tax=Agromyces silvae TaxID=3388266 RepID=UPI00280B85F1|nr:M23 family metallopeptidase [Agromyces protaetiae]